MGGIENHPDIDLIIQGKCKHSFEIYNDQGFCKKCGIDYHKYRSMK